MLEEVVLKAKQLGVKRIPLTGLTPQQRYRLKCSSPLYAVGDVVFADVDRVLAAMDVTEPVVPGVTIECASVEAMMHASRSLKYPHYWVARGDGLAITTEPNDDDNVLEYVA